MYIYIYIHTYIHIYILYICIYIYIEVNPRRRFGPHAPLGLLGGVLQVLCVSHYYQDCNVLYIYTLINKYIYIYIYISG